MLARNWNIGFILFDFSPFFPTWVHCLWIPYRQRSSIDLGLFLMVPSQHITLGQRTQSPNALFVLYFSPFFFFFLSQTYYGGQQASPS